MALTAEGWRALAAPKTIAIIGATDRASGQNFTGRLMDGMANIGYPGKIYFVNPSRTELYGDACYPNLAALPEQVDAVAFSIPGEKMLIGIEEAIEHGAKALLMYPGGFLERGAGGAARHKKLIEICAKANIPALGPNCLGIINYVERTAFGAMRVPKDFKVGPIAGISQSGACASILAKIGSKYGLSFLASTGNEAITTMEDLIGAGIDDPTTKVVIAFVEMLRRPREIFELGRRAAEAGKHVIVLKVGLTDIGGQVSFGHTGAIAGSGEVYRQAFDQAGITMVEDFDELAQTVELMTVLKPRSKTCRIGFLGTSGGELSNIADTAVRMGVTVPEPSLQTQLAFQKIQNFPEDLFLKNPMDVGTGFASKTSYHDRMRACIRAVADDPAFDIVALHQGFGRDRSDLTLSLNYNMLTAAAEEAPTLPKPIIVTASVTGDVEPIIVAPILAAGVPMLQGSREAMKAIRHMEKHLQFADSLRQRNPETKADPALAASLKPWAGGMVSQAETFALLERRGIAAAKVRRVASAAEAEKAAADMGGPMVMKVDTPRIVHKSDVGGVALGVTASDAAQRFEALQGVIRAQAGKAVEGEGVVAMPMLAQGVEFYIGAHNDESFGPVVACGIGGRFLEILGKTALLVAPFDEAEALDAIERSGAKPFLDGFRGGPKADLKSLAAMMVKVGDLALALGDRLQVLDLNPVIVNEKAPGGSVADARLILKE